MTTTMTAPRDDLFRMTTIADGSIRFQRAADPAAEGIIGTLTGYAAVFNRDTVIDSWEGKFIERIAPGAFRDTLAKHGDRVKVLFNHGFDPSIGDKPLGKPETMREDKVGLYVEVPLDDTSYNRDLVASLRSGALDGQSFRFSVNREQWEEPDDDTKLPVRTLQAVTLYEFGPVTFPAYSATSAGVRSRQAYEAWRAATESPTPAVADAGTAGSPEAVADAGTAPVQAPGLKDRAQAIARARAAASMTIG